MNNDLSLVFLNSKLTFTWRVAPICLTPNDLTYFKEQALVMGWGQTSEGDKESSSPVLLQAKVKVIGMSHCRVLYGFESVDVTAKMLCALGENAGRLPGESEGDSGGPLVWRDDATGRYFQVGVTSWGIGCGNPEYPGVYVKLNKYLDWIYANTGDSVFLTVELSAPLSERHNHLHEARARRRQAPRSPPPRWRKTAKVNTEGKTRGIAVHPSPG
ncbi:CUB-serine protease [Penaeus vannamei]|uniref:CUB-serine protease n=1 Tax=Penaeus vannamei TaxID=6689 RepID=A0A423SS48_PENVA|nr:CUB-serine protease [Penaeus vannamei]